MHKKTLDLQKNLNYFFNEQLAEDGLWGHNTAAALKSAKVNLCLLGKNDKNAIRIIERFRRDEKVLNKILDELITPIRRAFENVGYHNVDPLIMISQFVLETGYMKSVIKDSYNLGNIKARDGEEYVEVKTKEYDKDKKPYFEIAKFKKYKSYQDFFSSYIELLEKERYKKSIKNLNNAFMFFKGLREGGYATDPSYIEKNLEVYDRLWTFYMFIYNKD